MRPGLQLAGGLAASALIVAGAFLAFRMTRASDAVAAGAPLTWEVAAPALSAPTSAARTPVVPAAAVHRPLRLIVRRAPE